MRFLADISFNLSPYHFNFWINFSVFLSFLGSAVDSLFRSKSSFRALGRTTSMIYTIQLYLSGTIYEFNSSTLQDIGENSEEILVKNRLCN